MKLVDEIIDLAADSERSLSDTLRKCLILSFDLKNDKLRKWVEKELNGYDRDDDVPEYRRAHLHSKGNFQGNLGNWLPQRPLPIGVLKENHRKLLTSRLTQPIAVYDSSEKSDARFNWPPDLIAHYQNKIIEGHTLVQAWQELPQSLLVGLCEEVRNRVLRFALEIREELGNVDDKPSELPAAKVQAAVTNHIFGGINIISGTASNYVQIGAIEVHQNDFDSLAKALSSLNMTDGNIEQLKGAIEADKKKFGIETKKWLSSAVGKLSEAGLKVGTDVAIGFVKAWLSKYFGGIDIGI